MQPHFEVAYKDGAGGAFTGEGVLMVKDSLERWLQALVTKKHETSNCIVTHF